MTKYTVRAERTQVVEFVVVLPDDETPSGQRVQEELNAQDGKYVTVDSKFTSWLPTTAAQQVGEVVTADE